MTKQEAIAVPAHKSIASALAAAQMEVGRAVKDATNPHFKKSYADLSSVMDACMGPLSRNGIAVIQPISQDENGLSVRTVLIHGESNESLECAVPLIVQRQDMQGLGSAITYARRYGLMAMSGVAPDDDDGNAAVAAKPVTRVIEKPAPKALKIPVEVLEAVKGAANLDSLATIWKANREWQTDTDFLRAKDVRKAELEKQQTVNADLAGDEIPY